MERAVLQPAVAADAGAVAELVVALESSLYGESTFSQADLEEEWSELDVEHDARIVRDGGRIFGYGAVHELGGIAYTEGYVHPDALGRGIGTMLATTLEENAARRGARSITQQRSGGRLRCPQAAPVAGLRRRARLPRDAHRARRAARRTRVAGRPARRPVRPRAGRTRLPRRASGGVRGALGQRAGRAWARRSSATCSGASGSR